MIDRRQRRRSLSSTGKIGKFVLQDALRVQPTRSLYSSYDPFLDRKVAIKIIQLFDPAFEQDVDANEAFFSEASAIGRLQHQNIVSVYDAGVGDCEGYIVMEFVEGESLLHRLNKQNKLPLSLALKIGTQICHALEYASSKNVVHRDIKPSNIMLTADNNVKVVDFGISILSTQKESGQEDLMGTPSYIAPELVDGELPSAQTDLYSLAVLLYEMILGRLPFPGEDAHAVLFKVINEQPQAIDEDIPQSVKAFLLKALSKDPKDRVGSFELFEEQLTTLQDEVDQTDYDSILGTEQLQQLQLFEDCPPSVLQELAACLEFEKIRPGDLFVSENILDEYICLVQGKALLVAADKHIIVPVGQWLTEKTLHQRLGSYNCKALTNSLLLRVSKSNILESSHAVQAYFFGFILDRIFMQ